MQDYIYRVPNLCFYEVIGWSFFLWRRGWVGGLGIHFLFYFVKGLLSVILCANAWALKVSYRLTHTENQKRVHWR